jgi:hypothetical protein
LASPHRQNGYGAKRSPPEAKLVDQGPVAFDIRPLQVVQQAATLADQLQQPTPRIVVVGVRLQMLGEVVDPLAEDRDLDFR